MDRNLLAHIYLINCKSLFPCRGEVRGGGVVGAAGKVGGGGVVGAVKVRGGESEGGVVGAVGKVGGGGVVGGNVIVWRGKRRWGFGCGRWRKWRKSCPCNEKETFPSHYTSFLTFPSHYTIFIPVLFL